MKSNAAVNILYGIYFKYIFIAFVDCGLKFTYVGFV
jgi:hypothetical protein